MSPGCLTHDPSDKGLIRQTHHVFCDFYSSLYKSESLSDTAEMNTFLDGLNFPVIDSDAANGLDAPLAVEEIILALKSMQNNKAPGPDGFPVEFFKKFHDKLAPLLLSVYKESHGSLPPTLRQACISLLFEKDKDPDLCSSYRPLSLINVDAKILAKVLALRLEKILLTIISNEQTGFIKGHQLFYNVRTLLNVIYSKTTTTTPEVEFRLMLKQRLIGLNGTIYSGC